MEAATTEFVSAVIEPLEREWAMLENRTDFRADAEREQLRPRLSADYAERDQMALVRNALAEAGALAQELTAVHDAKEAALTAALTRITSRLDVPDAAEVRRLWVDSRELDSLRQVLYGATSEPRFSRPFDAVGKLRTHWEAEHVARQRVFTHCFSPGHRPAFHAPSWTEKATRLRALSEATQKLTPVKEQRA